MQLKIYNTLTRKEEIFSPLDPSHVRMYVCGPTVYDRAHLGNARPAVVFDVLYRVLKRLYPKVTYVRNITDIDDKIYNAAKEKDISIRSLTQQMTEFYHSDTGALHVLRPDIEPFATQHIPEMINMIKKIIESGHGYVSNDHVYFHVASFKEYGCLSHKNIKELLAGARVDIDKGKRDGLDFVLWKPIDEEFNFGWDSPWGKGRPGWHIECSAMSLKYLGECFDIHGGGIDLVFPHHENEIAQSCSISSRKIMAKYWIHNGHLNIEGVKMSKSLGNFFAVNDFLQKFDGEVIRLALLMTHYSSPLNFSIELLCQAKQTLDRWYTAIRDIRYRGESSDSLLSYTVFDAILNDLNTPKAISILHGLVDKINRTQDPKTVEVFVKTARSLVGLMNKEYSEWFQSIDSDTEALVSALIQERDQAKAEKDYGRADRIRAELLAKGIAVEDSASGTTWKKITDS